MALAHRNEDGQTGYKRVTYPFKRVLSMIVLAGTCDLPAKCLVLNCMRFNRECGCSKCLDPGVTFQTSTRGHVPTKWKVSMDMVLSDQ